MCRRTVRAQVRSRRCRRPPTPLPSHPLHRRRHREPARAGAPGPRRPRSYFSRYPESPSPRVYGEDAAAEGQARLRGAPGRATTAAWPASRPTAPSSASEVSPYGPTLRVALPAARRRRGHGGRPGGDARLARRRRADPRRGVRRDRRRDQQAVVRDRQRRDAHQRAAVRDVVPGRWPARPGPRRSRRSSAALVEQERVPASVVWEKPAEGRARSGCRRTTGSCPRGVALVIGCNTFPTWNGYPGLFASLATGNAVVVKPHPRAVLPLAITVEAARTVLEAAGFDPALVQLAAEADGEGLAKTLAERARGRDHRLHRRPRLRRLARGDGGRPRQAGLHREGRRQLDRRRLDRQPARASWATWPSR